MYTLCAFETSWYRWKKDSPWCSVFTEDEYKLLEFSEDLEYYYVDGYGYNLTYEIACPAIRDLLLHFQYVFLIGTYHYFLYKKIPFSQRYNKAVNQIAWV